MNQDSNSEVAALRSQVFVLLVALLVVSTTAAVYFYRQASVAGKELAAAEQLINSYNKGQPAVTAFVNQLGAYGVTHADIHPLLAKYGIVPAATQPNLAPPATPAPPVKAPLTPKR